MSWLFHITVGRSSSLATKMYLVDYILFYFYLFVKRTRTHV